LSDSFNHMAEALERNDQQRRALLADIAHELRTPLSVLRGRLEGIVDGIYPADDAHIATALEEVYLLERLVEDLRLLTLAEAGQLPLEIRQIDLLALANKSIETFACQAEELQIELLGPQLPSDLNGSADWSVAGDPQRLEQVIGNLIGNALRYVPTGGQISVRLQRQNGWLCLAVADNGPGVDEADLPYIFERFWRSEKSRARSSGGAGLGLAISKQLVEAMGGQIRARNLPEGGFEASLCLTD
jgi:two-component system OmpR family sensor kinase/two-component system sensor histidine kinase BaeS